MDNEHRLPTPGGDPLAHYLAQENAADALEAERRRLAALMEESIISPLNLLLAQATAYEQTFGSNTQARMAVSVLASLARQVIQNARDLKGNLQPAILETLGLIPALEALAGQTMRARGLHVALEVTRFDQRLSPSVELALFRLAQDGLERATLHAHASYVRITLTRSEAGVTFSLEDNGLSPAGLELLNPAGARIEQLGGVFTTESSEAGSCMFTAHFIQAAPADLTEREMDVIRLLGGGLTNKQIAAALKVSARTVNFHLDNIYSKLNVNSRTEAAIYALRQGWIRPD
jgi:DNA-binding CsgD family transcriptional regulator/signal transduction histidine kinase